METRLVKQLLDELKWLLESAEKKEEAKEDVKQMVTGKQKKYIYALADRAGFGKEALMKLVKQLTGKESLDECTRNEASEVIGTLSEILKKKGGQK